MCTAYINNIKNHLGDHIRKYINVLFRKKEREKELKNEKELHEFREEMKSFKQSIVDGTWKVKCHQATIQSQFVYMKLRSLLKQLPSPKTNNLWYDIKALANPARFLPSMIAFSRIVEEQEIASLWFQALPIRTTMIPCYIKLCYKVLKTTVLGENYEPFSDDDYKVIWWNKYFNLNHTATKIKYKDDSSKRSFSFTFDTDGIGCTLGLEYTKKKARGKNKTEEQKSQQKRIDDDKELTRIKEFTDRKRTLTFCNPHEKGKRKKKPKKTDDRDTTWRYIHELNQSKINETDGKCVLIDPNRRDLLYCMHETSTKEDPIKYRYTWNQQMKERDTRGIRKLYTKLTKVSPNRKQLTMELSILSACRSKSTILACYTKFVRARNDATTMKNHYQQRNLIIILIILD
jgi:hypothetical protein